MQYPNFNEEKKLWRRGYKLVVGLDEAGRGPLAGPVVAAAVVILNPLDAKRTPRRVASQKPNPKVQFLKIKDSKKLSPKKREEFFKILMNHSQIKWGIGRVSEKIIDKINILEATKLAMKKAIKDLGRNVDFLILDGNFKINLKTRALNALSARPSTKIENFSALVPQKSIIKADEKVFSCSAASIIAKVTRDRIMLKYDKKYPEYGFKKHKGYPTKSHRKILKKIGLCPIHRKSFSWA